MIIDRQSVLSCEIYEYLVNRNIKKSVTFKEKYNRNFELFLAH